MGLYVTLEASQSDLGTGFFSSANGQIVTGYHVIRGAKKIKAVDFNSQMYDDLSVDLISPQRDLAVLQIVSKPPTPNYLTFSREIPSPADELLVIGYPRGLPTQVINARSTSYKLLSSFTLRNKLGQRLFNQDIEILPLDATIYSGMSGAPVISRGKVHGVLSGSFDEGGTIAWMIPTKHLDTLFRFEKLPQNVSVWPAFDLMASAFRRLSRSFQVDSEGEQLLETYLQAVQQYSEAGRQIGLRAAAFQARILATRPFFQMFLNDPTLSSDQQTALNYLEYPLNNFLGAIEPYSQAHTNFGNASQELGNRAFDLLHWAEGLAAADPKVRAYLAAADQRIRSRRLSESYYQAIEYDPQRLEQIVARFGAVVAKMGEGYSEDGARLFASSLLELGNEFEADSAIHTSGRAISEMRRSVMAYRAVAAEFEPLVYQQSP